MLHYTFFFFFFTSSFPPTSPIPFSLFICFLFIIFYSISFLCFSSSISHVFLYGQVFLLNIIHHPKSEYCCIPSLIPLNIQKYFFSSLSLFYSKVWWSLSLGLGQLQQWLQLQVFNNGACSLTPLFLIL